MTELDVKLVKVDNWGIFFLQRLKHFFNRTDYCDLTLQFQDNAQLKVHRLVLSACTEYFELLERTCEMYEDCLVMPDDLQADVVVPIVNFMYTGQLEFRMDLLERLYQTSQIMNMPVLTKLLDAHRSQPSPRRHNVTYNNSKRSYSKPKEPSRVKHVPAVASSSKRPYTKAFGETITPVKERRTSILHKPEVICTNNGVPTPYQSPTINHASTTTLRKEALKEPRPTRYELPEELDTDNVFDNSFTNISYTSQPLMVHPETTKQYQRKKGLFGEGSGIRKLGETSTVDIVECKKVTKKETIFDEHDNLDMNEELEMFSLKNQTSPGVTNQLFDQIIDQPTGPKVTIEAKDSIQASNIDHAKIISEVLKKYPHLVKNNKNIKLKILNTPTTTPKAKPKKARISPVPIYMPKKDFSVKTETFETDVLDSKEAGRLIALGAENVKGPWICLICGTPGRALHFTSYFIFRRHLVEVHNEKPVSNMCEHCGLKSLKRNYLLHHLLTKHGVEPPPQYHFPRCNLCSYIALTEGLLVKHKLTHTENRSFRCNVCSANYSTSNQLLVHIKRTGHKYYADRKVNLQCVYCLRQFLREANLYAHLKTNHKVAAKADGIIDDSDDDMQKEEENTTTVKIEHQGFDTEYDDVETQYQIRPDGNIEVVTKPVSKQRPVATISTPIKQKILNAGVDLPIAKPVQKEKPQVKSVAPIQIQETNEEIVMIDNNEYIMKNNQLIPKKKGGNTYVLPDIMVSESHDTLTTSTSLTYSDIQVPMVVEDVQEQKMMIKKSSNLNQPIQIVVSNEEEYKALMNSNHSIIFDDGDNNKTLTVLSTPHNAAINTLDLENAQSNDMMIIQDNYPINVSEGLSGDNSNIVVVYSHGVDQNKQFQLISSQDIGAQFVQSSAVLTQNFATPSTVTSVMANAQVIDSQITESWQNNAQDNQAAELTELAQMEIVEPAEIVPMDQTEMASIENVVITPTTEIEMASSTDVTSVEHTELTSVQNTESASVNHDIQSTNEELPEVTLTSDILQVAAEATVEPNEKEETHQLPKDNEYMAPEASANEPLETVEDTHNTPIPPTDVDISTELVTNSIADITESAEEPTPNEPLPHNSSNEEHNTEENEQQVPKQQTMIEQNTENNIVEEHTPGEQTDTVDQATANIENDTGGDSEENDNTTEEDSSNTAVPISDAKIMLPEETKEQIQSLTSEWSEDEYDTESQEQVDENPEKAGQEVLSEPHELEESIENIQQEMEKQTGEVSEAGDTEDSVSENLCEQQTVEPPQAKISSLLNDWDENDSQEGNDSTNGTEDDSVPIETADEVAVLQKIEPKKVVKIQTLVSDWDDEEEDNKN